jgi:protein transport protein SEC23
MFPVDVLRWLDKALIRLCARFGGQATMQTQESVAGLLGGLPALCFHLRRSQLLQVFNCSPDETAFFRLTALRQPTAALVLMLRPSLTAWAPNSQPCSVPLDVAACQPDRILLLDTFFHLVVWHGSAVTRWRSEGLHQRPEYAYLMEMLRAPLEHARTAVQGRFPTPRVIECTQSGSQARFLMAKLNPSVSHHTTGEAGAEPPIFSDDVTLQQFTAELGKMVATEKL